MRNEIKYAINRAIQDELNARLEYETEHKDAGDNYSHLPREGGWRYNNGDSRLAEFMEENEIDTKGLDIDHIADLVLDNFKMESGHIFSGQKDDVFTVDSFPVGEIEAQIDYDYIADATGYRLTKKRAKTLGLDHANDDNLLAYESTDSVWFAVIAADEIQELINDNCE